MGIIIASPEKDLREIEDYSLDLAFGSDENDFTLTCTPDVAPPLKGFVYIDNTEYGGTVDAIETDTETGMCVASGRTWHGILATRILVPDEGQTHLTVKGYVPRVIGTLITRMNLSARFHASSGSPIKYISYTFDRFTDGYTGLRKMMAANGLVLVMRATQQGVELSGVPVKTIEDEIDSDRVQFTLTKRGRCVNHLVCAGKGEGTERTVIHLYADADGNVSQTQSLTGMDEVTNFYDCNNVEDEDLLSQGTDKLTDMQSDGGIEVSIPDDIDANVGDTVVGFDAKTAESVTAEVGKKIVKVEDGLLSVSYEVGDATGKTGSTSTGGGSSSGGGGHLYYAGDGLTLSNWTFSADVTEADITTINNNITTLTNSITAISDTTINSL